MKKVSNAKADKEQEEEAESDEEMAPALEEWDANETPAVKGKKGKAVAGDSSSRQQAKKRAFTMEQSGAVLLTCLMATRILYHLVSHRVSVAALSNSSCAGQTVARCDTVIGMHAVVCSCDARLSLDV